MSHAHQAPSSDTDLRSALAVVTAFVGQARQQGDYWDAVRAILDEGSSQDERDRNPAVLIFGLIRLAAILADLAATARHQPINALLQEIAIAAA